MCGICGKLNLRDQAAPARELLDRMVATIRHRGPDDAGVYLDDHVGLGHARLSIIDLSTGDQPMANADGSLHIVFNGEIFNYVELRADLEARGRRFRTTSDTEVILQAYEERGAECVRDFVGDFAFAIWDARRKRLFCARDRMGVRPFVYTVAGGALLFGSEAKALFADPAVEPRISPRHLAQTLLFWAPVSPDTVFEGVQELPPGHTLTVEGGHVEVEPYWKLEFPPTEPGQRSRGSYAEELRALLEDAVRLRLRADVTVGAYLSGGLDSSATAALMLHVGHENTQTFSVAFEDPVYDESAHQMRMGGALGTEHHVLLCKRADIARAFPEFIRHTEAPVLRTAGAPLFLLSEMVREHGIKVVVTGEGADEVLAGYDVFKEMKIRRFWARNPESAWRPLLLGRLYQYFAMSVGTSQAYAKAFFGEGLTETADPLYSHLTRFSTTGKNLVFLSRALRGETSASAELDAYREHIRPIVAGWDALSAAQYIEATSLLPSYILHAQGDRPGMAHAVENRLPFLDHRVVECAARIPPNVRMPGLTEKWALRRAVRDLLPTDIVRRVKQPYMAPDAECFLADGAPEYVTELLSPARLAEDGLFEPKPVERLVAKCRARDTIGFRDNMAFIGILSAQILNAQYVRGETVR